MEMASSFVDLATIIYGMIAVTFESGVNLVFWALEQRKNRRAENERQRAQERAEWRAEGRTVGRAEGRREAVQEIREAIRLNKTDDEIDALLEQLGRENGVNGAR